jgi:hypothetical protein
VIIAVAAMVALAIALAWRSAWAPATSALVGLGIAPLRRGPLQVHTSQADHRAPYRGS